MNPIEELRARIEADARNLDDFEKNNNGHVCWVPLLERITADCGRRLVECWNAGGLKAAQWASGNLRRAVALLDKLDGKR